MMRVVPLLLLSALLAEAFVPLHQQLQSSRSTSNTRDSRLFNIFNDIGDMISGQPSRLDAQDSLPYDPCFCGDKSLCGDVRTFAVQERLISFTGEDFDVSDATSGAPFVRVRGAMLHLPGKDKMTMFDAGSGKELLVLDRKLIAATPTYDIFRSEGGEKIGWIEKKLIAMTDTFDIYMEGKGGFGVTGLLKPPPAYRVSGDFIDRSFVMRNDQNQVVARVSEDWIIEFDAFNHYQVQVAPGMDAMLVLAALCAIDEEFDEEHKAKKEQES
eukprot:CAMPEP_0198142204 /NCGR_PEP_ID=MMETSP1443-20131203/5068_1 /TAXON_ID=186043 /ORGANISM="Entomoneis sp., Strain CCMP2396" /LENGTH=269 /DNA_ID=CAMNT_0043805167 /DNA_START=46 /DNA_END=855 /DNA_ORIENTATION=+